MGEDIRRRVVTSFRNAIDFEQNNNDLEAYRKYLDGVALVAAALQQDADCTWVEGKPNLSEKERKSLLGFAKQSVDRLIFLLEKQDESKCSIFQNFTTTSTDAAADSGYNQVGNVGNSRAISTNVPQNNSRKPAEVPVPHYVVPSPHVEEPDENDISPIERMRKENHLLMKRYATRIQSATTKAQCHNLQLELERRLMENSAIAQQQQEAWDKQRSKVTEWCFQVAEEKFKIKEKIDNGTITEADFKKQRIFAAALKYEEEHLWLKRLKQDLLLFPKDEERQRDIVAHVLNDKLHPLGNLMGQMQHAIVTKVTPLIMSKQESSYLSHVNINKRKPRGVSSTVEELSSVFNPTQEQTLSSSPMSEEVIEQEERKAFQRHFSNIADDIKQDVKLLEILFYSLYEPLESEPGSNILTELLHELYFPAVKYPLICLIRFGISDLEMGLTARMAVQRENPEVTDLDEEILKSSCHALHRITCLSSPCQMLDSLTALMKCLATSDDPQTKSVGADDLLPRLMNVVMSSGMPNLLAEALYMETFMPVSRALGEAGYCLTVLQSVMTCVQVPTG